MGKGLQAFAILGNSISRLTDVIFIKKACHLVQGQAVSERYVVITISLQSRECLLQSSTPRRWG